MADNSTIEAFLKKNCDVEAFLQENYEVMQKTSSREDAYCKTLEQLVTMADGELSQQNVDALTPFRGFFIAPQQTVEAIHSDFCGSLIENVFNRYNAIALVVDGYDADISKSVRKVANTIALLLRRETAMSCVSKAVRKIYVDYIKRSRAGGDRAETAKDLKKMVAFNTLVVTELVNISTEITLKDDLPETERAELYKIYLLFCVIIKNDGSECVRLNLLGKILGLTEATLGRLDIEMIRELKKDPKKCVDTTWVMSENLRQTLFGKTVDAIFSSGTGEFDKDEVFEKIPLDLNIDQEIARKFVLQFAQTSLTNSLYQAKALLKQRNHQGVVSSLNNLLACDKAVSLRRPLSCDKALTGDLYSIYMKTNPTLENLDRLQYLLGIVKIGVTLMSDAAKE